jgi:inositol transport system substrate-binding protein
MAATVEQNPGEQIRTALREVVANLKDKTPIASKSLTPVLITKDNLSQASRIAEVK